MLRFKMKAATEPIHEIFRIFIDENLKWGDHVSHVLKKVSSGLSILKMSKELFISTNSKNLIQLFDRDPFPLWQHYLVNCGGTFLTRLHKLQN